MYSWVVIYSQNVCPPVKLWQESVKIEKLVMLQGCIKEKSLEDNEGDPSLGWAPSGRGQSHFSWCVWVQAGWSSGSSPRALLEPKALVTGFTGGAGGWTAAACGVQEFRVNNWTVCMALNSVNMWRIQFAADGSTSALEMFIPVPGGCPGSSSPLVSLLQLFLFIKRVKCLQHFA